MGEGPEAKTTTSPQFRNEGALSLMLGRVLCSEGDGHMNDEAKRIIQADGASQYSLAYNNKDNTCLVVTSTGPGQSATYHSHHLRFSLKDNITVDSDAHIPVQDDAFLDMFTKLISRQFGKEMTILSLSCGGKSMEIVEGKFDPDTPPENQAYYSVAITPNEDRSFAMDANPIAFEDTKHAKTLQYISEAKIFYRDNLVKLVSSLDPYLSVELMADLRIRAARAARAFSVHISADGEAYGASAEAFGRKYMEISSGLGREGVMSKMLHELMHLMGFNIPTQSSRCQAIMPIGLEEGITEYLTRLIISKNDTNLDFEKCPCSYYETDILYVLERMQCISLADMAHAYLSKDADNLIDRSMGCLGSDLIWNMFYEREGGGATWFRDAISYLMHTRNLETIKALIADGEKDQMLTEDTPEIMRGIQTKECPELSDLL